jgi:hypothetical protein
MTVLEMHIAVQLELDKSSSFQLAAFEPEDIDFWLNEAQTELVKRKAFGNNYRQEEFDSSIKRMEDLTTLVKESSELSPTAHAYYTNVDMFTLPSDYMFLVGGTCKLTIGDKVDKLSECQVVKRNEIGNLVETIFNKPFLSNPYIYLADSKINVISDPFATVSAFRCRYIKKPGTLVRTEPGTGQVTTSELPLQVHPELVALTTFLMLENIESQRLQTNQLILNSKE